MYIAAPLVKGRKGHYKELFEQIRKKGFLHVRIDGEIKEVVHGMKVDRYKTHFIEMVVDRVAVSDKDTKRLKESIRLAMQHGKGIMMLVDKETDEQRFYQERPK